MEVASSVQRCGDATYAGRRKKHEGNPATSTNPLPSLVLSQSHGPRARIMDYNGEVIRKHRALGSRYEQGGEGS